MIPTYRENELIRAEIQFRYTLGVERLVAFFQHQVNPYVHQALFGHVVSQAEDVSSARLVGQATVIEDAYGEHRCESLRVSLRPQRAGIPSFCQLPLRCASSWASHVQNHHLLVLSVTLGRR